VGTRQAVDACRRNPLARALRVDKLTLAALEATLALYRNPDLAVRSIPALAMLTATRDAVHARAATVAARLARAGVRCAVVESEAAVGGGAFPTAKLASAAIAVDGDASALERDLRSGASPVVGRIVGDTLLLDLRSIAEADDGAFAEAVISALGE
jgi:L-seryl-tRNA(Ser) seleniumtransferase